MTDLTQHFVDPSIPGLSGRDLVRPGLVARSLSLLGDTQETLARWRQERVLRRDLAHLDAHLLRDLGLDRSGS